MRRGWSIVTLAIGLSAVHCSVLTTFDGYVAGSGTATDGGVSDAPAPLDAATTADAAAPVDAGSVLDAADADAGPWCLTRTPMPAFCDDFDDVGDFTNWNNVIQSNGAKALRDSTAFVSAPSSLLTQTAGGSSPSPAFLRFVPKGVVTHLRYGFDYRIDVRDSQTGYAEVAYIRVSTGSDFYMRVGLDPAMNGYTAEAAQDGGSPVQHNLSFPKNISFDTWKRVTIDLDMGAAHQLTVAVNGVTVGTQPLEQDLYVPGTMTVDSGYGYNGYPSGPWKMRFDNVTIDWN